MSPGPANAGPDAAAPPAAVLGDVPRVAVGLVRVLRSAGLQVPVAAVLEFVAALRLLGLSSASGLYWAGRATLLTGPEDLELYDRCFSAFFALPLPVSHEFPVLGRELTVAADETDAPADTEVGDGPPILARYSARELLRARDFATLTEAERREAAELLGELRFVPRPRRTRRVAPARHRSGRPDLRAAVRKAVRNDGEMRIDRYLERKVAPRRLVLLLDVSGSMQPYSRELLRFAQVAVASDRPVEVFTLGTRLTRVTRHLAAADPDRALKQSVAAIPDLAGGTRLGESLQRFNSDFGVRGVARGAVVVLCSDGIDRGDTALLEAELERLRRVASEVIWVNPLKASPGYAPLARGMAAALPHVDRFLEGHSVNALAQLAAAIAPR